MQAKWQGIDMQDVYQDWAEALQNCSLGSINFAINQSKLENFPPSQGSFLSYCQQYKPPLIENRIEKLHVKDCEAGLAKLAEIKKQLAEKMKIKND